jgi:hypothetical protein
MLTSTALSSAKVRYFENLIDSGHFELEKYYQLLLDLVSSQP